MPTDNDKSTTTESSSVEEEKALIMEMNQLITEAVESYVSGEGDQELKKYLIYFDSPVKGRRLYLVTDDEYIAGSTRHHIGNYYGLRDSVSVEAIEPDVPVDETPKYDSSDALYLDLWW